jgi:hypothetical protein
MMAKGAYATLLRATPDLDSAIDRYPPPGGENQ